MLGGGSSPRGLGGSGLARKRGQRTGSQYDILPLDLSSEDMGNPVTSKVRPEEGRATTD